MNATATFMTEHAARHMQALCRHFSNKVPAQVQAERGHVAFPFGQCDLSADAKCLTFKATAPDRSQLDQVTQVLTSHLERFAFREDPNLTWDFSDA